MFSLGIEILISPSRSAGKIHAKIAPDLEKSIFQHVGVSFKNASFSLNYLVTTRDILRHDIPNYRIRSFSTFATLANATAIQYCKCL